MSASKLDVNLERVDPALRAELTTVDRIPSYLARISLDNTNSTHFGSTKMNQTINGHLIAGGLNLYRLQGTFNLDSKGDILNQVQTIYKTLKEDGELECTFYIADDDYGINFTAAPGEEDLASALAAYASPSVVVSTNVDNKNFWSIDFVGISDFEKQPILHQHVRTGDKEYVNLTLVPFYDATTHYIANMAHWGKQHEGMNGTLITKGVLEVISKLDVLKGQDLTPSIQGRYRRLGPPRGNKGHFNTHHLVATTLEMANLVRQHLLTINEDLCALVGSRVALFEATAAGVWTYTKQIEGKANIEPPNGYGNFYLTARGQVPVQLPAARSLLQKALGKEALVLREGRKLKSLPLLLELGDAKTLDAFLEDMDPSDYTLTRKAQANAASSDPFGLKPLVNDEGPKQKKATLQRHQPPQRLPTLSVDAKL